MRVASSLLLLILLLLPARTAAQTTWIVDEPLDEIDSACVPVDCSLREAIAGAAAGDRVEFGLPGSPPWTIRLDSGLGPLTISIDLTLAGPGASQLTLSGDEDGDGDADGRVLEIAATGSLAISGVRIEKGRATSSAAAQRDGGCIRNAGSVVLANVELADCSAWSAGSALVCNGATGGSGGAVYNAAGATLLADGVLWQANFAGVGASTGDCAAGRPGGSGGALANAGSAIVSASRFFGNAAGRGGQPSAAGGDGGAVANLAGGILHLSSSTLDANASGDGSCFLAFQAPDGRGGGVFSAGETAIDNSTLSGNQIGGPLDCQSARGGGLNVAGGTTRLRNGTVATNTANGVGGGIAREGGILRLRNTLVAGNAGSGNQDDCTTTAAGSLVSEGYNAVAVVDGCSASLIATGDQVGTIGAPLDLVLGALADHGGPTPTHDLGAASPAIDGGDPAGCVGWDPVGAVDLPMTSDQRGEARPTDGDGDTVATCDAGSFEAEAVTPVFHDLEVFLAGAGLGSVLSGDGLIDCPGDCVESYLEGSAVELTATAEPGAQFAGWSGDCAGTSTCQLSLDQARSVTATFDLDPTWTLQVSLSGDGAGAVTSGDGLIDCPSDCDETYSDGTVVTLTAAPLLGSLFAGWSGDCSGAAPTCMLTLSTNRAAGATFLLVELFADDFELGDVCAWTSATGAPPCL